MASQGVVVSALPGAAAATLDLRPIVEACRKELEALKEQIAALGQVHIELRQRLMVRHGQPVWLLEQPLQGASEPLVPRELWGRLPEWIKLSFFRGQIIPSLETDPLFWGKGDPCILPFAPASRPWGRGAAVLVPGGNYEFLTPQEGSPLARWLVQDFGIAVCLLRYRLLPSFDMEDMVSDLKAAVRKARTLVRGGPVVVFGFSAGAHLSAVVCAEAEDKESRPDAQVFLYPVITADDWFSSSTSGFFRAHESSDEVRSLARSQKLLLPGPWFVRPPPTFMVSSVNDSICPPTRHGDLYAEAMADAGVPHEHLRADFGDHGFSHHDFWRGPCLKWLRGLGFGPIDG